MTDLIKRVSDETGLKFISFEVTVSNYPVSHDCDLVLRRHIKALMYLLFIFDTLRGK